MKKAIGIIILGLLWCNVGVAEIEISSVNTYLNKGYKLHSINISRDDKGIFYHLIKKDDFITCIHVVLKDTTACFGP